MSASPLGQCCHLCPTHCHNEAYLLGVVIVGFNFCSVLQGAGVPAAAGQLRGGGVAHGTARSGAAARCGGRRLAADLPAAAAGPGAGHSHRILDRCIVLLQTFQLLP